jgi:hypothetical protein
MEHHMQWTKTIDDAYWMLKVCERNFFHYKFSAAPFPFLHFESFAFISIHCHSNQKWEEKKIRNFQDEARGNEKNWRSSWVIATDSSIPISFVRITSNRLINSISRRFSVKQYLHSMTRTELGQVKIAIDWKFVLQLKYTHDCCGSRN